MRVADALAERSRRRPDGVAPRGTGGDTGCYEQTLAIDADHHQSDTPADGFGRPIYAQRDTGNGPSSYALSSTTQDTFDDTGRLTRALHADGASVTTYTYDAAGRLTGMTDPDRGAATSGYDGNGNPTQPIDGRCGTTLPLAPCAGGTTCTSYDGLDRPLWRNTAADPGGAYVTSSYDGTANGSDGAGRLAAEVFRDGAGTGATAFSGAYTCGYDALGRVPRVDQTMGGAGACPAGWSGQDVGGAAPAGGQNDLGDGVWSAAGGGHLDIQGTGDAFHSVSQPEAATTAVALSARLGGVDGANGNAEAGPMFRASTAATAPCYVVVLTPGAGQGVIVLHRDTAGGRANVAYSMTATRRTGTRRRRSGRPTPPATTGRAT